mgnify:CR=1 FL=1
MTGQISVAVSTNVVQISSSSLLDASRTLIGYRPGREPARATPSERAT